MNTALSASVARRRAARTVPRLVAGVLVCVVAWLACRAVAGGGASYAVAAETPTTGPAADAAELRVRVIDVRNRKGTLVFGVFRQADGFPSNEKKSVAWELRKADAERVNEGSADTGFEFVAQLPPGRYAASILHDENNNGKMDTNFMGIPREGYGVTNNPKPRFRGATFDEATFDLPPAGRTVTISLQYF